MRVDEQIVGLGEVAPGPVGQSCDTMNASQQRAERKHQMDEFVGTHGRVYSAAARRRAGQEGLEPPTRGFGVRCSTIRATALEFTVCDSLYLVSL